jgi:hypothetical protein
MTDIAMGSRFRQREESPMNRSFGVVCVVFAVFLAACATADPGVPQNNASLVLGLRAADSDGDYTSDKGLAMDDLCGVTGIEYTRFIDTGWGWEAGLDFSEHQEFAIFGKTEEDLDVLEFYGGGRYTVTGIGGEAFDFLPYVGAGVSALIMDGRKADDFAVGLYGHLGAHFAVARNFTFGPDIRGLVSTSDDVGVYLQFGLQLGWSF